MLNMSLKIEPINEIKLKDNNVEKKCDLSEKTKFSELKYKFLHKIKMCSSKLKKSCSGRTCNAITFQCRQILPEQRSLINTQFWIEMNANERLNYIIKNTKYIPKNDDSETCSYKLTITGQIYNVCKKMFMSTLTLVEKNVRKIIIDNYENIKDTMHNDTGKNIKTNKLKAKASQSNKTSSRNKNEDTLKIEYIEVVTNNEEYDLNESDKETNIAYDIEENKVLGKTCNSNTKAKVLRKKKKFNRSKTTYSRRSESSLENDSTNSDESWNVEQNNLSFSNESASENDVANVEIPKRLQRKSRSIVATPPVKKLKIENQSEVENINTSSSDDNNFSNVEDTDESESEENNKTQIEENSEYSNGITIPKKPGATCSSKLCVMLPDRSCHKIKNCQRENIFEEFWKMSLSNRKIYVKHNVEVLESKGRPKNITPLIYHLTIEKNKLQVCQRMFNATLALNNSCVYNWIYDCNTNNDNFKYILDPLDTPKTLKARKRFENYFEKLQLLEDFLDSLDKMPQKSFVQQKAHKHYLTEKVEGLRNLQMLYKSAMKSEGIINPLSVKILKRVFCAKHFTFYTGYKKRNAKFKTLDDSQITPEIEETMKRDQQERQRDKILTKKPGSSIFVLDIDTCDGKVSPNWNGDGDDSENNSRLRCFNLTVSNIITLHTCNYWFCEIDALDSTPSSFITCLMDYLINFCINAKQIIIYGRIKDPRFKNIDMTNALLDYSIINKVTIIQKFYIPRKHLYKDETECQSVYRSLYRKLQRFEINLPSDYITATIDCKREPMEAKWFHFNQFRDYSSTSKKHRYINLSSNEEIHNIKSIMCKENGTVSIKMDFDDDWLLLPSCLQYEVVPLKESEWPQLYYDRRKISAIKYQLLQSLKAKLPRDCHFFYDYLTIEI